MRSSVFGVEATIHSKTLSVPRKGLRFFLFILEYRVERLMWPVAKVLFELIHCCASEQLVKNIVFKNWLNDLLLDFFFFFGDDRRDIQFHPSLPHCGWTPTWTQNTLTPQGRYRTDKRLIKDCFGLTRQPSHNSSATFVAQRCILTHASLSHINIGNTRASGEWTPLKATKTGLSEKIRSGDTLI